MLDVFSCGTRLVKGYANCSLNSVKRREKNTHQNLFPLVCDRYIIVVEHDLSVLDYLSDFICCLYGVPSAYGVVTMPFSVREGSPPN